MKTTIKIIEELRSDASDLAGKIIALSKNRRLNIEQRTAIEEARKGIRFITVHHFCRLRKAYGDSKWQQLEVIDVPEKPENISSNAKTVAEEIVNDAQSLQRKMLEIPGRNGCNEEQSAAIDYLILGFRLWRNVELNQMLSKFQ